jgi:DNA topoisomerase-2
MKSDKIQQLSQVEHVFKRSSMYIGDITTYKKYMWFIEDDEPYYDEIYYNDGYFKIIQEPIDNAIDEYIKTKGKFGNILKVNIKNKKDHVLYTIEDNGRGLSTDKINDDISAKIAFTSLMAGSNFDDTQRSGIGMNGVGVSLTNLFSKKFKVVTVNDHNKYVLKCENNMSEINEKLLRRRSHTRGTTLNFIIDLEKFKNIELLTFDNIFNIIKMKLIEIKTLYDDMSIYLNDEEIIYGLPQYLKNGMVYRNGNILLGLYSKNDNEADITFANGVNTYDGGSHLSNMTTMVYGYLRKLINQKYKVDLKPSLIQKEFYILFSINGILSPNFIGQYKSKITISIIEYNNIMKDHIVKICEFLNNYFQHNETLFYNLASQYNSVAEEKEITKIIKIEKKRNLKNLDKFIRIEKHKKGEGDLFIAEGDSAIGMGLKVRDNKKHAFYALGGKFINVINMRELKVRQSKKVNDLLLVLGVDLRDDNYLNKINFKNIYLLVDNDTDGQHIAMLLILFFYKFFPDIITKGRLRIVSAPLVIAKNKKTEKIFYNYDDFINADLVGFDINYYKGLGTYDENQYRDIIFNPRYKKIQISDITSSYIEKIFSDDASYRKLWLEGKLNGK